jgi:hypothetical protein
VFAACRMCATVAMVWQRTGNWSQTQILPLLRQLLLAPGSGTRKATSPREQQHLGVWGRLGVLQPCDEWCLPVRISVRDLQPWSGNGGTGTECALIMELVGRKLFSGVKTGTHNSVLSVCLEAVKQLTDCVAQLSTAASQMVY